MVDPLPFPHAYFLVDAGKQSVGFLPWQTNASAGKRLDIFIRQLSGMDLFSGKTGLWLKFEDGRELEFVKNSGFLSQINDRDLIVTVSFSSLPCAEVLRFLFQELGVVKCFPPGTEQPEIASWFRRRVMAPHESAEGAQKESEDLIRQMMRFYIKHFLDRCRDLEACAAKTFQGLTSDLPLLARTLHLLAGSGASYGFPGISRGGLLLENTVKEVLRSGGGPAGGLTASLYMYLSAAKIELMTKADLYGLPSQAEESSF